MAILILNGLFHCYAKSVRFIYKLKGTYQLRELNEEDVKKQCRSRRTLDSIMQLFPCLCFAFFDQFDHIKNKNFCQKQINNDSLKIGKQFILNYLINLNLFLETRLNIYEEIAPNSKVCTLTYL